MGRHEGQRLSYRPGALKSDEIYVKNDEVTGGNKE